MERGLVLNNWVDWIMGMRLLILNFRMGWALVVQGLLVRRMGAKGKRMVDGTTTSGMLKLTNI
jgi:hypothetical protein